MVWEAQLTLQTICFRNLALNRRSFQNGLRTGLREFSALRKFSRNLRFFYPLCQFSLNLRCFYPLRKLVINLRCFYPLQQSPPPPPRTDVLSKIPKPSRRSLGGKGAFKKFPPYWGFFPLSIFFHISCCLFALYVPTAHWSGAVEYMFCFVQGSPPSMHLFAEFCSVLSVGHQCGRAHTLSLGAPFGGALHPCSVCAQGVGCIALGTFGRLTRPRVGPLAGGGLCYSPIFYSFKLFLSLTSIFLFFYTFNLFLSLTSIFYTFLSLTPIFYTFKLFLSLTPIFHKFKLFLSLSMKSAVEVFFEFFQ